MATTYITASEIRHGSVDSKGVNTEKVIPEGVRIIKSDIGDDDAWDSLVEAGAIIERPADDEEQRSTAAKEATETHTVSAPPAPAGVATTPVSPGAATKK